MKFSALYFAATIAALSAHAGMVSSPAPWKGESETSFSITPHIGLMEGMTHEYVFLTVPSAGYDGTLSRLDWKIKNVLAGGLEGGARWGRFTINGGIWTSLNEGGGRMKDYDWAEIPEMAENEGFSYSETESNIDLDEFYAFDVNAGYDFLRMDSGLTASAFVGARYETWRWSAYGLSGFSGFPEKGLVDEESEDPSTKVIGYKQEYLFGYAGLRAGWSIGIFNLNAYAAWAPGFHVEDNDFHCLRETIFETDNDYSSHIMLYGVSASAALSDSLTVTLAWEALNSGVARTSGTQTGEEDDEDEEENQYPDASNKSGIKMRNSFFSVSVGYVF